MGPPGREYPARGSCEGRSRCLFHQTGRIGQSRSGQDSNAPAHQISQHTENGGGPVHSRAGPRSATIELAKQRVGDMFRSLWAPGILLGDPGRPYAPRCWRPKRRCRPSRTSSRSGDWSTARQHCTPATWRSNWRGALSSSRRSLAVSSTRMASPATPRTGERQRSSPVRCHVWMLQAPRGSPREGRFPSKPSTTKPSRLFGPEPKARNQRRRIDLGQRRIQRCHPSIRLSPIRIAGTGATSGCRSRERAASL